MAGRITFHLALLAILLDSGVFVAAESLEVDATNILLTSLAPLLGLFGERFAQQFLSESFTIQDHILFAMAPLGVLTAIAGAIRVGGASWLKRLVGRARETYAQAEIELMSSVSQEVCELWNGKSIVRTTGRPEIKQIIHLPGDISPKSFITVESLKEDHLLKGKATNARNTGSENSKNNDPGLGANNGDTESGISESSIDPTGYKDMPPNISLNIHGGSRPSELWVCAIIATILQIAVLVWSAITAYSSYARKRSRLIGIMPSVGFPLQAAGTVFLTWGLFLCAGIIDRASCEQHWPRRRRSQIMTVSRLFSSVKATFQARANKQRLDVDQSSKQTSFRNGDMQIYWVQKQHTAGDTSFDPYILYAGELKNHIHESHRAEEKGQSDRDDVSLEGKPKPYKKTTFAIVIGILGFLAQFQGLRLLNWTCSIAQLIALIVATILRAWVRRSMNKTPVAVPVNNDYILDNLALAIVGNEPSGSKFPNSEAIRTPGLSLAFGVTDMPKLRAITKAKPKHQGQSEGRYSNRANVQPVNLVAQPFNNVQSSTKIDMKPSLAQQALDLRVRLGRLTRWTGAKSQEAINLSNSIEAALERLSPQLPAEYGAKCAVVLQVNTYRNTPHAFREEVELYIVKDGDRWKVNDAYLEALLSLVSYSAWVAEQNRRTRDETDKGEYLARLNFSGLSIKEQSIEDCRSTGWLRAKAPESQIYHRVLGKSSSKLLIDLFWWTSDTEEVLHKVEAAGTCKEDMVAVPKDFGFEIYSVKVIERHALGFHVNDAASKETNTFWSLECTGQQAFILHLFSTFMWATMEFIASASQFHPTTVIKNNRDDWLGPFDFLSFRTFDREISSLPKLRSDKIESLVQDLQSTGLGTSDEIYRVLVPPLSYFDKLPNEAVADWCNERLIGFEFSNDYHSALGGYVDLLEKVQHREVQDRFAKRAAALVVGFLLRVIDDPKHKELSYIDDVYNKELRKLLKIIANKSVLRAVLSLEHIITRQGKTKNYSELRNLVQLESGLSIHALEEDGPGENDLEEDAFNFPNSTDVFGWTDSYWESFQYGLPIPREGSRQILDLAGQSVLHHIIDSIADWPRPERLDSFICFEVESRDLLPARCNNQTPLHRAATAGYAKAVGILLKEGADSNAADSFGRTALFLAAYHGHSEVVDLLCDNMDHAGLNRTDEDRRNALHYAILNHQEIAAILEQKHDVADLKRKNNTATLKKKEDAAVLELIYHVADLRRIHNTATLKKKEDAAVALIEKGLDINAVDVYGCTPLWYAASEGMKRVVKNLLTRDRMGLAFGLRGERKTGFYLTPEQEAKRAGHQEIAKVLGGARKRKERKERKQWDGNDVDYMLNEFFKEHSL